ncbi:hypothetical protein PCC9214_01733 [Planktothrix tepida]|uniref:Uncharacterized protein n=2 Tax=Planktothrix TaxID=54304 RepID=A0A1J1LLF6_9CYAN|nr:MULTISPECIES: hypothetical protein [Planktothrix]CAD5938021.1 hypothetical protein PCC9214_01733 [Planktothrix tepida]CAD5973666.1 hypothetical protein NO713_04005 [Planktothrix pseudagardhii]CUR33299.1 conserved hypothetical protein [Planktothrix tepida PCC 9214]
MSASPLTLNLTQGSVSLRFTPEAAQNLKGVLDEIMQKLKAVAAKTTPGSGKPTPQKPIEYQYTGDIFLEVFCNPNIWPSPFAAKVLITVRDERIKLMTEAELTRIIDDVNQYLDQVRE